MKAIVALFSLLLLAGCANKANREVVDTVCFSVKGFDEDTSRFAQSTANKLLDEYGLKLVAQGCDAEVRMARMNTATTSERSLLFGVLVSPTTYAQVDGIVTIVVRGTTVVTDESVQSSKYTSTASAIQDFVWNGLKPVIKGYRRSGSPT